MDIAVAQQDIFIIYSFGSQNGQTIPYHSILVSSLYKATHYLTLKPEQATHLLQISFVNPSLPGRCRTPWTWAILHCLPKPQAWSLIGHGAVSTQTCGHMGYWSLQVEDSELSLGAAPTQLALEADSWIPSALEIGVFFYNRNVRLRITFGETRLYKYITNPLKTGVTGVYSDNKFIFIHFPLSVFLLSFECIVWPLTLLLKLVKG